MEKKNLIPYDGAMVGEALKAYCRQAKAKTGLTMKRIYTLLIQYAIDKDAINIKEGSNEGQAKLR